MGADLDNQASRPSLPRHAREHILVAVGAALLAAGLALVVGVLPAEFGVDPTGLGARLGVLALADMKQQVNAFKDSQGGVATTSPLSGSEKPFTQETVSFTLEPGGFIEYKYRLDKGQALLYSWQSDGGVVSEFHAEPDGAPKGYAESYEKRPASRRAAGTLVAPFAGIHGWYWENPETAPVTVTLTTAGFYALAHEFRKDAPPTTRTFR